MALLNDVVGRRLVYFDVLAKVMLRCPRLLCLKLEGPLIAHTANDYSDYIPCRLEMLILKYCRMTTGTFKEILIRSGHCLEVLHLEMIQGIDRTELGEENAETFEARWPLMRFALPLPPLLLAIIIGACLPSLKMLTIITPDPSSTAVTMIEMQGIMDYILAQVSRWALHQTPCLPETDACHDLSSSPCHLWFTYISRDVGLFLSS